MYSETLAIMDRNMERLMVDELREEKERLIKDVEEMRKSRDEMRESNEELLKNSQEMREEIIALKAQLSEYQLKN